MFLNLDCTVHEARGKGQTQEYSPLVPEDARIVNEDGHAAKGIQRGLDDGLAIGDRGVVHDRLAPR